MLPSFARLLTALFRPGRPATWLAAAVVTLAVPAAPAHAQFLKKLKQAAAEKAAEAAGRKVLGEDRKDSSAVAAQPASNAGAAPAAARPAVSSAPARSSGPTRLEITPERVDQFLAAMEPTLQVAREREAFAAAGRKVVEYEKCLGVAGQKQAELMVKGQAPQPTKAQQAEIDRIMAGNDALSQALLAAMAAQDTARTRVLSDSSLRVNNRAMLLMNPLIGKMCGDKAPTKPTELDEARLRKASIPRKIDGWSPTQFGLMRERIAMHFIAPEKSGLTPEERGAIDAKRAAFQPYLAMWRETGDWKSWYEIGQAWR
jgi:hypothetical protein